MTRHPAALTELLASVLRHRELLRRLVRRDIGQRYAGSMLGLAWAVITPLLTALVFSFVFGTVFRSRWGAPGDAGGASFTVILLIGLAVHGMFAEAISRAPHLVVSNPSYVKKVVFPLELLAVVAVCAVAVNGCIGLLVALVLNLALAQALPATLLLLPLVLLPFLVLLTGVVLIVAATGVYLRDLVQVTGFVVTLSLFLTPIFYPITALPPELQPVMLLNPMAFTVEQARAVAVFGQLPDWQGLGLYSIGALAVLAGGFWWFQRVRNGFADVV